MYLNKNVDITRYPAIHTGNHIDIAGYPAIQASYLGWLASRSGSQPSSAAGDQIFFLVRFLNSLAGFVPGSRFLRIPRNRKEFV